MGYPVAYRSPRPFGHPRAGGFQSPPVRPALAPGQGFGTPGKLPAFLNDNEVARRLWNDAARNFANRAPANNAAQIAEFKRYYEAPLRKQVRKILLDAAAKKIRVRILARVLARLVPGLGTALLAYDLLQFLLGLLGLAPNQWVVGGTWTAQNACPHTGKPYGRVKGGVPATCNVGVNVAAPNAFPPVTDQSIAMTWVNIINPAGGFNSGRHNAYYTRTLPQTSPDVSAVYSPFAAVPVPGQQPLPNGSTLPVTFPWPAVNPGALPIGEPALDPLPIPRALEPFVAVAPGVELNPGHEVGPASPVRPVDAPVVLPIGTVEVLPGVSITPGGQVVITDTTPPPLRQTFTPDGKVSRDDLPHKFRPPGKRTKEVKPKSYASNAIIVGRAFNSLTELEDLIDALWWALPAEFRSKAVYYRPNFHKGRENWRDDLYMGHGPNDSDPNEWYIDKNGVKRPVWKRREVTMLEKFGDIYDHVQHIQFDKALKNVIANEINDRIFGTLGRINQVAAQKSFDAGHGPRSVAGPVRGPKLRGDESPGAKVTEWLFQSAFQVGL